MPQKSSQDRRLDSLERKLENINKVLGKIRPIDIAKYSSLVKKTNKLEDEFEYLNKELKAVAEACKTGSIDPDLLSSEAATFTISNLGNYGVEMFTPVLNVPQACILGVNTIIKRPAELEDGSFGFVPYIGLSLTYDHRALDGGQATKLLTEIKNEIEILALNLI